MAPLRAPQVLVSIAAAALLVASVGGFVRRETDRQPDQNAAAAGAVTIIDFAFEPEALTAATGDTVTWLNEDSVAHTVTSDGDGPLDSGDIGEGAGYEVTFDQPGTYAYICTIHPTMRATVEVTG